MENNCQIIMESIHNCSSYSPDKFRRTDSRTHKHRTVIVTTVSLTASGLNKNHPRYLPFRLKTISNTGTNLDCKFNTIYSASVKDER